VSPALFEPAIPNPATHSPAVGTDLAGAYVLMAALVVKNEKRATSVGLMTNSRTLAFELGGKQIWTLLPTGRAADWKFQRMIWSQGFARHDTSATR
jgi:hypothetical protein